MLAQPRDHSQLGQLNLFPVCFYWECDGKRCPVHPPESGDQGLGLVGHTP